MAKINFVLSPKEGETEKFFKRATNLKIARPLFEKWGKLGVSALANATPHDSGETANSWRYKVEKNRNVLELTFSNTNMIANGFVCMAIILQYGHLTKSGSFVEGIDFINPAIQPIFDGLQSDIIKELDAI